MSHSISQNITVLWQTELHEPASTAPVITGDVVCVATKAPPPATDPATLVALTLTEGREHWRCTFPHTLINGMAPLSSGGLLLSLTSTDFLQGTAALIARETDGTERWHWVPEGGQHISAPATDGQVAVVTVDTGTLAVIDLASGDLVREIALDADATLSAPALAGDAIYVPCREPRLLAVGLDGDTRWEFQADAADNAWFDHTPVIAGERLYAVLSSGWVFALDRASGELAWRTRIGPPGRRLSAPATDGDHLYVGARDGVHALNLARGRTAWTFAEADRIEARPSVVRGAVYAASRDHHLYALARGTGQERWRYALEHGIQVAAAFADCDPVDAQDDVAASGGPHRAGAFVVDRTGKLVALSYPLTADEFEAEGRWAEAAAAYEAANVLDRAAALYEAAGRWQQAAGVWAKLDRPLKRAHALTARARDLAEQPGCMPDQIAAWKQVIQIYEVLQMPQLADDCHREAVCLHQPVIALDVIAPKGLVLHKWSWLQFSIRNEGHGPARNLAVRARGDEFEGQVMATQRIITLPAGAERTEPLSVRPLEYGDGVPLHIFVEYLDQDRRVHSRKQFIHVAVAQSETNRAPGEKIGVLDFDYHRGLRHLGDLLKQEAHRAQFSVLEARLLENLSREQVYGSNETTRTERSQVVMTLNQLARKAKLEQSFNDLCRR